MQSNLPSEYLYSLNLRDAWLQGLYDGRGIETLEERTLWKRPRSYCTGRKTHPCNPRKTDKGTSE